MNGGLFGESIKHCVRSSTVLVPRLRTRARVDDCDSTSLVDKWDMGMTEAHDIMGECSKPCEPCTPRIDVLIIRFPWAGMDEEKLGLLKRKVARGWHGSKKLQSFGGKGLATFLEISRVTAVKKDVFVVALNTQDIRLLQ